MKKQDKYLPANAVIIALLSLFTVLVLLVPFRFNDPLKTLKDLIITGIISITAVILISRINSKPFRALMQTVFVLAFFSVFFGKTSDFQLILYNEWQDNKLLTIEHSILGSETSLILEKITTPVLTEVMMFVYIIYIPLLAIVAFVSYKSKSEDGLGEYLFILSLGYFFCFIGFMLFPVASQTYFNPTQYSVSLKGGIFAYLGELLRNEAHFPGGSLPSPHCTASTIMLFALNKVNRKLYYFFFPVVLMIYISTVYGRYHYIWDGIVGILLALILIKLLPAFQKITENIFVFFSSLMNSVTVSGSLSDE